MAVSPLPSDITSKGMDQQSLFTLLENLVTVVNELVDDHATNKTFTDELKTDLNALRTDVLAVAAKLDLDAGVTDTNYAATCTATAVASSGAATLTNATDLTLLKG